MSFPVINHLNDLLPHIKDKQEIRVMDQPNGTKVVCYMVSAPTTFDNQFAKECRGITFDRTGKIICRPLHKFFNVNENQSVLLQDLDWSKVVRVMDKRDGSMITPVILSDGTIVCKSKKTFTSDVAVNATTWLHDLGDEGYLNFAHTMLVNGWTPIFEWTSSKNRIVIDYKETERLVLLHCRNIKTGEYMPLDVLADVANTFDVDIVKNRLDDGESFNDLIQLAETAEGLEGWVVQFTNGDMVKLKTSWYIKLHHVITFLRVRDIAGMVLDEKLDDVKAVFVEQGISLQHVNEIEKEVAQILIDLRQRVELYVELYRRWTRKEFAIKMREDRHFGLMMSEFIGQEPDYIDFFRRNILSETFSLDQV
jgi:RNA ligase